MSKIHGPDKPADLMPKGQTQDGIQKHMKSMRTDFRDGRAESAVQLHRLQRRRRLEWASYPTH